MFSFFQIRERTDRQTDTKTPQEGCKALRRTKKQGALKEVREGVPDQGEVPEGNVPGFTGNFVVQSDLAYIFLC